MTTDHLEQAAAAVSRAQTLQAPVVDRHLARANTALGIATGALAGSLLGTAILPGIGIALAPVIGAALGGFAGNYATRIGAGHNT